MAQTEIQLDPKIFSCFLCLERLEDPVTTFCGHSYCWECLQHHWDAEDELEVYSCPQCGNTFPQRPVIEKNTMLAALFQTLGKTGLQAACTDDDCAETGYVSCDVCIGRKLKALQSCLVCRASYCDSHIQPHRQSPAFLRHKLVKPTKEFQENICHTHDEVKKMFCHSDQQRICFHCSLDEHKGHDITVAALEKQREREETKQKIPKMAVSCFLSEPKSREGFLRYSRPITLDVNTINYYLLLSEEGRKVTGLEDGDGQCYCDHPERFTDCPQVLSKEGLTGRCYWEVEWAGSADGVDVALAYKNKSKGGKYTETTFGFDDQSWSLLCYVKGTYTFYHNSISTDVSGPKSSRVGVYLDHKAGLLSFYSVSDSMELLLRVQTTFTQPLHAGLSVYSGSMAKLI